MKSTGINATSVSLEWEPPECVQRGGQLVDYPYVLRNALSVLVVNGSVPRGLVTIGGLTPYTEYRFSAVYRNSVGEGPLISYSIRTDEAGTCTKKTKCYTSMLSSSYNHLIV